MHGNIGSVGVRETEGYNWDPFITHNTEDVCPSPDTLNLNMGDEGVQERMG